MNKIAQTRRLMRLRDRNLATWIEWQELRFILVSVGLPVLLVALVVQLLPPLLRLF